ncbi:hypothetical protein [Kineococcus sp. SYSU DK003]
MLVAVDYKDCIPGDYTEALLAREEEGRPGPDRPVSRGGWAM